MQENTGVPTLILAVGDYALVAKHNGESYTTRFSVTSGEIKQIEVVMESKDESGDFLSHEEDAACRNAFCRTPRSHPPVHALALWRQGRCRSTRLCRLEALELPL